MPKIAFALFAATLLAATTACTSPRSAATGASAPQSQPDEPRVRSAGRAAGAGGSHAPGSTGSGHGTFGADSTAEIGSAR